LPEPVADALLSSMEVVQHHICLHSAVMVIVEIKQTTKRTTKKKQANRKDAQLCSLPPGLIFTPLLVCAV